MMQNTFSPLLKVTIAFNSPNTTAQMSKVSRNIRQALNYKPPTVKLKTRVKHFWYTMLQSKHLDSKRKELGMTKDKSTREERVSIYLHYIVHSGYEVMATETGSSWSYCIHSKGAERDECLLSAHFSFYSVWAFSPQNGLTTCKTGISTSSKWIHKCPHKHAQEFFLGVILDPVK